MNYSLFCCCGEFGYATGVFGLINVVLIQRAETSILILFMIFYINLFPLFLNMFSYFKGFDFTDILRQGLGFFFLFKEMNECLKYSFYTVKTDRMM